MKAKSRKLIPLSDSEYFNENQNKIKLLNCSIRETKCKELLSVINKSYIESEQYQRDKEFHISIEILKSAYFKTLELKENSCINCTNLFRSTITESLKNMYSELENMSKGIFRNKRYQPSLMKAEITLKEFENVGLNFTPQMIDTKETFLKNHSNKSVSF